MVVHHVDVHPVGAGDPRDLGTQVGEVGGQDARRDLDAHARDPRCVGRGLDGRPRQARPTGSAVSFSGGSAGRRPVGVPVQPDVLLAVRREQGVVEPAYGAGRVAVVHPLADRLLVGGTQHVAELVEGGDPELQQEPGDPGVVVAARPAGVGVLAGEEGRELTGVEARVVVGGRCRHVAAGAGDRAAQPVADGGELLVGELEQPGREGEAAVEVGGVLGGHGALVADVVLELGPGVLQHGADLHLHVAARQVGVRRLALASRVEDDLEVAAGVAEPALAGRLAAEVAVVGDDHLVGQQVGDRRDVVAHVGDHPDAELVADLAQRVGVEPLRRRPSGWPSRRRRRRSWCGRRRSGS